MMRGVLIGILFLMAGAVGWLTFDWYRTTYGGGEAFGAPFTLVDQKGAEITEAAFKGSPTALFFGFTHCPEVCPTTLYELDGWLAQLGEEGEEIEAYFVSIDPERDTPDVLDRYVANVSERITGITGEPQKVAEMAKAFKIYAKKVPLDGGDYTMDHTASVLLLGRDGDFFGTIAYGENAETAIAKLKRLANES
ncbi:SCO family protein [Nitratireductor alexandrii]|uniref:SCO family protein n=1 Tax=Nitratireductor alexandrii TaxID=2448161 RepID=UPI000FD91A20|nr:SCO family protein [Nitratireductor alexandrii]